MAEEETTEATTETAKPKAPRKRAAPKAEKQHDPLHVPYFDASGEQQGEVALPKTIFAEHPNVAVMHQAYLRQLANARQGTASTKTRATVSGGGAKPYRQKGTGRARHGSTREPSMKGGAKVFGPKPRDFSQRMPKQMRRLALRSALSQKAIDGQVRVIEAFGFEEPRTGEAAGLLDTIGFDDTTLIVLPAPNLVVSRSFENLATSKIVLARNMNVRDLFTYTYLLLAKDSIELLVENFQKRSRVGGKHEHDHDEEAAE
ncbi:MAG TPA: 50S ribosomal protein L4 [Candidatus Dormibacteraeota bacterium]|nr:50S ribosomal protein L4 [Candidatus Dormibacteraeota bacterium]